MTISFWKSVAIGVALLLPAVVNAQTNLPKNISLVVPFPPGGGTDLFARQVGQRFAARTGSNVIVDNRAGAGGLIGAEYVSRAPADGSVVMITASDIAVTIATRKQLPFDANKGLIPAAILATGPMLLVVNAQSPYRTLADLLQDVKKRKGQVHYGSAGIGSLHHLTLELLNSMAGLEMTHVPYKGSAAAVLDLTADRIQVMVGSFPTTGSHIKAGKLRPLAVTSAKPSRFAPELPTVAASVPGFDVDIWWGLFVPGAMAQPLVERLNADMLAIVASADMRETFERDGVHPGALPAAESAKLVRNDIEKWREVARRQNIIVD
jgi:tripartite-type tricarboxylate transporter receptor subunit TctC